MFDREGFIAECRSAIAADRTHRAVREVVARAVADPAALLRGLGEPQAGGITALYRSADLTILNLVWAPWMTIMPHNHNMWAVIGVYSGREDNIFWRRLGAGETDSGLEAAGAKSLSQREVAALGADIVHSVTNPLGRCTGAIHVYGGDFFATPRSEWDAETLTERPYDVEHATRLFAEANARAAPH